MQKYDVVIVGAGPAGLSAATYAAADGYEVALVEQNKAGGQMRHSPKVDNVIGLLGMSGRLIADEALRQAEEFGVDFIEDKVSRIVPSRPESGDHEVVLTSGFTLRAPLVLLAMGARFNRLEGGSELEGHELFYGQVLTHSAQCRGKDVIVIGGGNAAAQSIVYLASFCRSVTVLIRQPQATWSAYLRERIAKLENVYLRYNVKDFNFVGAPLHSVEVNGHLIPATTVFALTGTTPNLGVAFDLGLRLAGSNGNRIVTGGTKAGWLEGFEVDRTPFSLETNIPGIFAAGDVRDSTGHGIAAAMGDGNVAASLFWRYLMAHRQPRFQALYAGRPLASLRREPDVSASVVTPRR